MSVLRVRAAALALLCLHSLLVSSSAATSVGCTWGTYDFSSLMGSDLSETIGDFDYYVNVCGELTSHASCTTAEASSTCRVQTDEGGEAFDMGNLPSEITTWAYIDTTDESKGVQYTLTGPQSCWLSHISAQDWISNVQFLCSTTTGPLAVEVPSTGCTFSFTYPTPLACPPSTSSGKHKLSGGWVFIIILCVTIPLYVIGGCIYKAKRLGATGTDRCPNVEFWRDLPSLCKEGCAFTWSKLRGLCGGGGAYESV